jgi:ubiquinone/menaquinone biosynthesis C-methylase UbiE
VGNILKDRWNPKLYDQKHSFVSKYGDDLVELLAPKEGENILDLGCGTGDLAKKLSDLKAEVTGADKSENMVAQAISKYPNINFIVKDATELEYHEEFDAVFSNATLHWVKPPHLALECIFNSLKKGGRFVAEFGGKGNVKIITDGIISQISIAGLAFEMDQFPWFYPSIGEYSSLMEAAGFRVTFAQHYDRPTPLDGDNGLRNWIDMFGSNLLEGIPKDKKEQIIVNVENNLKEVLFKDGNWVADYKRIRVFGIKE